MRLDHLCTYLIHDSDTHYRSAFAEAYPALVELKSQGIVPFSPAQRHCCAAGYVAAVFRGERPDAAVNSVNNK